MFKPSLRRRTDLRLRWRTNYAPATTAGMHRRHLVLGGWGVAPESVRESLGAAFPNSSVEVTPPTRAGLGRLLRDTAPIIGWSLGAHLLLDAALRGALPEDRKITLICPFPKFPREAGEGGRCALAQVRLLRRRLAKDAPAALGEFYSQAGIALPAPQNLPYGMEELIEGLTLLEDTRPHEGDFAAATGHPNLRLLAGAKDALIDANALAAKLPGLRVLSDAGHNLAGFVKALSEMEESCLA